MTLTSDFTGWVVLIVDDEEDNLVPITRILRHQGAQVHFAQDGLQGLETLSGITPTVILLDLSMPTMDGWEMLRQIRANSRTASTPTLALTAHALQRDRDRALEAGFDGFITKPSRPSILIDELKANMDRIMRVRSSSTNAIIIQDINEAQ